MAKVFVNIVRDIYAKDYREMSGRGRGFVARGRGVALPIPLQWGYWER